MPTNHHKGAGMYNPYKDQHMYTEGEMGGSRAAVRAEYENGPGPLACDCGGVAYYKATVGVRKCVDCGALYHGNGSKV